MDINYFPIYEKYGQPLYRPPAEAYSLILKVTEGCSWNKCAFCEMYRSKHFSVRNETEIFREIEEMGTYATQMGIRIRKIFLADGNALVLSSQKLIRILSAIKKSFPQVGRISTYALPQNVLAKSLQELQELKEAGLQLIYVGIESGDDEVLEMVNKGESASSTVEGLIKAQEAGFKCSVMIINGLAGQEYSEQHAINSARVVNQIQPQFLSTLVLMLRSQVDIYKRRFAGKYIHMGDKELVKELQIFIENTELKRTIYRSDHVSNFLVLKGTLSRDKERFLREIQLASMMMKKS